MLDCATESAAIRPISAWREYSISSTKVLSVPSDEAVSGAAVGVHGSRLRLRKVAQLC
jgi:hypothetical protein